MNSFAEQSVAGRTNTLEDLVRPEDGRVSRAIFVDAAIYRLEQERIFARSWSYMGHESQLRNPGDYITNFIGEDPVIAVRDESGQVRVLLNSCRHRGKQVCSTDRGTTKLFRCAYHGWTYNTKGALMGVPRADTVYHGELDKSRLGLVELPRVESHQGMIFAHWDAQAEPLVDYLGKDMLWYLDVPFEGALGGLEVLGPVMKFRIETNWKIPAENFAGDDYHVLHTHGSGFQIDFLPDYDTLGDYIAYFPHGHGMGDIPKPGRALGNDLAMAQMFGSDGVDYVNAYQARLKQRTSAAQASMHGLGEGNIFPNLSWIKFGCFHALGFYQWHPKGPGQVEVWQTALFDAGAPQVVKDFARSQMSQENAAAGIFGQDDGENFEQITESAHGYMSLQQDFNYTMGLGHEGEVDEPGYPGQLGPHFSEQNHRNYYRYYRDLMAATGDGNG